MSAVMTNIRKFRSLQFEKYSAAYVSISLPQLLDLFVGVDVWVLPLVHKVGISIYKECPHTYRCICVIIMSYGYE